MGLFSKIFKKDPHRPGQLAALKNKGVLMVAVKVGADPTQQEVEHMVQNCEHPAFKKQLKIGEALVLSDARAREIGSRSVEDTSKWNTSHLVFFGCAVHITDTLSKAGEFPKGIPMQPTILYAGGDINAHQEGDLFLVGGIWQQKQK